MRRCQTLTLVRLTLLLFALLSGLFARTAEAYPPAVPRQRVYDLAGYMPDTARRDALTRELLAFEETHGGIQVAVVTVPDTGGEGLERYAHGLFRAWGIGQQGQNNGVLLLVSRRADAAGNKTRIEVGYGLEGALPDATCHRIITETIMPLARDQHNPQGAIEAGARLILHHLGGQGPLGPMGGPARAAARTEAPDAGAGTVVVLLPILFGLVLLAWIMTINVRRTWARRRTWRKQHKAATDALACAIASAQEVASDARSVLIQPAGTEAVDSFLRETDSLKRESENALKEMMDAIDEDVSYSVRQALDRAEHRTRAIDRSAETLRERTARFRRCAKEIASTLATAADTLQGIEAALAVHRERGIRIPTDALAQAHATLAQARALQAPPEGELPDPETAASTADEAVRLGKAVERAWESRLARARQVEASLHAVPAEIEALRRQIHDARDTVRRLRETHAEGVWRPAEQAFTAASQAFEPILNLRAQAVSANGVLHQEYERAAQLADQIRKALDELARNLSLPKARLLQANTAKVESVAWPEQARTLAQELDGLVACKDISEELKRRLRHAANSLKGAANRPQTETRPDWLQLASAYAEATGAARRLKAEAEAAIAAKRPKPRHASSGNGHHGSSSSGSSSSWETSSPSSSWSSSDSGSSFGGGDSGGGGSSGGFD